MFYLCINLVLFSPFCARNSILLSGIKMKCVLFFFCFFCCVVIVFPLSLHQIVYDSSLSLFLLTSEGMHRICLIILNQPLDKDYLHILWSKGVVYFTHYDRSSLAPLCHWWFHLHWFALSMNSLVVCFFLTVLSLQRFNCCHVIENTPSLFSAHTTCELGFN